MLAELAEELAQSLINEDLENIYGAAIAEHLLSASRHLLQLIAHGGKSTDSFVVKLRTIFTLANDHINAISFKDVEIKWLRLYTDVCILQSATDLAAGFTDPTKHSSHFWGMAIQRLDMAIIVAGAVGPGRNTLCQSLIHAIQDAGLSNSSRTRRCAQADPVELVETVNPISHSLKYAPNPVPCLSSPPSIMQYLDSYRSRPFVLRRYLNSNASPCPPWKAIQKWRSAAFLLGSVGEGRVVPVEIGEAYIDEDWGQQIIPFRDFLAQIGYFTHDDLSGQSDPDDDRPFYLAQHTLFNQFPELARDFSLPDYVWSNPPAPAGMPEYRPPQNEDGVLINVWIGGGRRVVSPPHTDPYYNCYAQVIGCKRVWLAPPEASRSMHAFHGETGQCRTPSELDLPHQLMANTSQIPVLRDDDLNASRERYPSFFKHVWPLSLEAVLEPGDLLIMPPGWWHAMRAESDGVGWSISMWY